MKIIGYRSALRIVQSGKLKILEIPEMLRNKAGIHKGGIQREPCD